jgi:hypothetical protein
MKTLPQPNPLYQAAFNKAVTGVLKQGRPCIGPSGGCKYSNEDGDHCALGHLPAEPIPDRLEGLFPCFEETYAEGSKALAAIFEGLGFTRADKHFLEALRDMHDDAHQQTLKPSLPNLAAFIDRFKANAIWLSATYGLTLPKELES